MWIGRMAGSCEVMENGGWWLESLDNGSFMSENSGM